MPVAESQQLFPGENIQSLIAKFLDGSIAALTEANWMATHSSVLLILSLSSPASRPDTSPFLSSSPLSLYSTQTLLVLVSPANHLGRGDWYLSALAVGIRIAQALSINWLGEDSYPATEGMALSPMDPNALVLREMCKRIWYQLVAQVSFEFELEEEEEGRACLLLTRRDADFLFSFPRPSRSVW